MINAKELINVLLEYDKPSEFFEKMKADRTVFSEIPELASLIGVMQNQEHHKEGDVWNHTMLVIDEAAGRKHLVKNKAGFMLSALCHDFGKTVCTTEEDGVIHAYGHETAGLPIIQTFLERAGADSNLISYVLNMTELHMDPGIMARMKSKIKKTNRLFFRSAEPFALIQLSLCDGLGKIPPVNNAEEFLFSRLMIYRDIMARPYLSKDDIVKAGVPDDEHINEVLEHMTKLRLAGVHKENALIQTLAFSKKIKRV